MSELKPCPFCGEPVDYDEDAEHISCKDYENGCGFFFDISTYPTKEEAVVFWNRRAQPAAPQVSDAMVAAAVMAYVQHGKNRSGDMFAAMRTALEAALSKGEGE